MMECGKLIVIDWDDTLLPTSHLDFLGYDPKKNIDLYTKNSLERLEKSIISLLIMAKMCGKVCIVTNSQEGWVDMSCGLFIPNVKEYIKDIDIISARSLYENKHPKNTIMWKIEAMNDCVRKWFRSPDVVTDFISLGDSFGDRHAAKIVGKGLSISTTKSIKFANDPTSEQLIYQQKLIHDSFPYICTHKNDIDLILDIPDIKNMKNI